MIDSLIKCPICNKEESCYVQPINETKFAHSCFNCGYQTNDLMKEGDFDFTEFESTLPELHKECKTRTELMNKTNLSNDAYERLCKLYKLKEKKLPKTTQNGGASIPIIVYKLIEVPREVYSSRLKAKQIIFPSDKKIGLRIRESELNYDKKIEYQTDKDGRKIRARLTGKQTQIGNRTPANEIQIYELIEEFVGKFPSREEVYRQLGELAIQKQLNGEVYQSKGYRFYEKN
jgi:hypothetical protein